MAKRSTNGEEPESPVSPVIKRRKLDDSNHAPVKTSNTRRKTACQACRLRKIKCDALRPTCGICQASDAVCKYTDPLPERLTYATLSCTAYSFLTESCSIDSATDLLSVKLDRLSDDVERLQSIVKQGGVFGLQP